MLADILGVLPTAPQVLDDRTAVGGVEEEVKRDIARAGPFLAWLDEKIGIEPADLRERRPKPLALRGVQVGGTRRGLPLDDAQHAGLRLGPLGIPAHPEKRLGHAASQAQAARRLFHVRENRNFGHGVVAQDPDILDLVGRLHEGAG